mgnify:CR=1 FL=1
MRVMLELLRILFIVVLLGGFLGYIVRTFHSELGVNIDQYGWIANLGILILIFVLYRNKLQFNGWYKGKGREKLSKGATQLLHVVSMLLISLPAFLNCIDFD